MIASILLYAPLKALADELSEDKKKLETVETNLISSCDMLLKLIGDRQPDPTQEGLLQTCDKSMTSINNYCGIHKDLNLITCSDQRIEEYISARGLAQPGDTSNQGNQMNQPFANPAENTSTALPNKTEANKMSIEELGPPTSNNLPSNVQRIINELGNDTSDEIATYQINDLSPEVLVKVLNGLSVNNLYKVLRSLTPDDLKTLLNHTLTSEQSNQILDRLPQSERSEIVKSEIAASI